MRGWLREPIAETAHGLNVGFVALVAQDFSQPLHVDIDGPLIDVDVTAPHLIEQLVSIECLAGVRHEEFEQPVLNAPQI